MESINLNNRQFYKNIGKIAIPIAVQSLIGSSLSLIDNLMVGSLGEAELAAVGAAIQPFFIHWMFLYGFSSGSATFIAQFFGNKDMANIKKTIGFTIAISMGLGIVFFTACNLLAEPIMRIYTEDAQVIKLGVEYIRIGSPCFLLLSISQPLHVALRATQQTQLPLYITMTAFAANTALNYIFIFGKLGMPQLGTAGAAVATLIARTLELVMVIIVVFGFKNIISGRIKEYTGISRELIKRILKNNIPTTANESLWGIGQTLYMSAVGHIGVTAYAATQACHTIENMFVLAGFSLGDAALIVIGQKIGEGNVPVSKVMAKKIMGLTAVVGIIMGGLLIICSRPLIGFFDFTPAGHEAALKILIVYGCAIPVKMFVGVMITGVLRGGGDTAFAAICELCCVWAIGVPMAFLGAMVWHLPVYFVILLTCLVEVTEIWILLGRYRSGKWAKNVIENL